MIFTFCNYTEGTLGSDEKLCYVEPCGRLARASASFNDLPRG